MCTEGPGEVPEERGEDTPVHGSSRDMQVPGSQLSLISGWPGTQIPGGHGAQAA